MNDIELVGVAGQSNSVKMIGCSALNGTEISRHCTPVISISGFFSTIWNFFSFSYTYSKGKNPRVIDLVGCSDMENPASMNKIKTLTNADAVSLFDFEGKDRMKILKRYFYYGNDGAVLSTAEGSATKTMHKMKGINIDLSEKSIFKVEKEAFWEEENKYNIEMLNLTNNEISEVPLGFFPNSTFSNMKYLDLSHNKLTSLHKDTFENLTSVADLILAGNMLMMLSNGIFANNPLEVNIFKRYVL